VRSDGIGKSLRAISTAVALFLCTVTCSLSLPDGPKPLRIVASYHDLENIRHYTPARNDYWHEIFIRRRGGGRADTCNIAPAEFQNYSCVILAGGTAKIRTAGDKISPDETAEIVGFMEQGGVLVVAFPSYMRSFRAAFGEVSAKIRIVSHQTRRSFRVEEPAHPLVDLGNAREEDQGQDEAEDDAIDALLEADEGGENLLGGAPVEAMDPSRMISSSFSVLKFDGAESLAGDGPNSCYMIIPVGQGKLILAPQEVFPDYSMAQLMDSDGVARDMKLVALKKRQRLAANLFRFLSPPRIGDVISDACAEGPRVRFWYRDIPTITTEGPERMNPPVPLPGEEVAELAMDVGQTEWERRIFYMTLNRPVSRLSATLSELRGASGVLAPDSSELLALLPPTATFSGPFVYLGKQQDPSPRGAAVRDSG